MDKTKKIWSRFNKDQKQLKIDCVDLVTKCYMLMGNKPETEQIVLMAQFLFIDLTEKYGNWEMDEVEYAITNGLKNSDTGGFINVRNFNQWLKEHKKAAHLQKQKNQITEFENHKLIKKAIDNTINKAKQIDGNTKLL